MHLKTSLSVAALCVAITAPAQAPIPQLPSPVLLTAPAPMQAAVIKEILVRGNSRVSTDVIKAALRSAEGRPFLATDLDRDQQSLRSLGLFKDVRVSSRPLNDTEVQILVDVEENPVVKEISIVGNTAIPTEDLLKLVTQQKDQVLNLNTRRTTADAIRKLYEEKGFFAEVDFPTLEGAPETLTIMVIESTVNEIVVTGLNKTRKYVIDRLLKTEPGKPFNIRTWLQDRRRLESTQWFEAVNVSDRRVDLGRFDLLLDLKEQRSAVFDVGVALDPRSRLAGTIKVRDTNFRGMGQSIGLDYLQDTFGSGASIALDYSDPFVDNRDSRLNFSLYSRVNSYFTRFGNAGSDLGDGRFDERRTGGSASLSRGFRNIFSTTLGLSYESIQSVNADTTTTTNFIQQDGTLLKLLIQGTKDTRDVPLDPFEGELARLSIEPGISNIRKIGGDVSGATEILGQNTFVKTSLEYKRFFSRQPEGKPLDAARPVIATRIRAGAISGEVPFFEQFFIGGADTLRGYNDQRFWGKYALSGSAEYRYPLQSNASLSLVGFVDYGGAWGGYGSIRDFDQRSSPNFNLGYGAGLGFRTPIGSIRIDFGFTPKGESKTHFTIGGSF